MKTILPPATIGIFGSGQLGMMLAKAAQQLGYQTWIYSDDSRGCAHFVTNRNTTAHYVTHTDRLREFIEGCDVITLEFENIPASVHEAVMTQGKKLNPGMLALETSQDRYREKSMATQQLDIPCPRFTLISKEADLNKDITYPVILKTCTGGYDGKGQRLVTDRTGLEQAWDELKKAPCIAEEVIDFALEFSIILARNADGEMAVYEPFENKHSEGILRETIWPCQPTPLGNEWIATAKGHAMRIADKLKVVGLLAVEFFLTRDGRVIFNEIAPRPHNSGHITNECARTSQFEQHVRAICGLPLGSCDIVRSGRMVNVIGDHDPLRQALSDPNVFRIYDDDKERKAASLVT